MGTGALRLVLLGAGLLFLALLAWLGGRRPRRVQREETAAPAARAEPHLGDGAAAPWTAGASAADALGPLPSTPAAPPLAGPGAPADPPVLDWQDVQAAIDPGDAPEGAPSTEPVTLVEIPVMSASPARRGPPRGWTAAAPVTGDPPVLVVAWPPEAERYIASLRILPARSERLSGRLLRQGLGAAGFRHGPFGIFHVGHDDGRVLFSAASLVRPGLLDPETMDFHQFPGVSLFAVLPAVLEPAKLLERMADVAFDLAARIEGAVQDESGSPLGPQESADWRARCIAALAQRAPPAGAH